MFTVWLQQKFTVIGYTIGEAKSFSAPYLAVSCELAAWESAVRCPLGYAARVRYFLPQDVHKQLRHCFVFNCHSSSFLSLFGSRRLAVIYNWRNNAETAMVLAFECQISMEMSRTFAVQGLDMKITYWQSLYYYFSCNWYELSNWNDTKSLKSNYQSTEVVSQLRIVRITRCTSNISRKTYDFSQSHNIIGSWVLHTYSEPSTTLRRAPTELHENSYKFFLWAFFSKGPVVSCNRF